MHYDVEDQTIGGDRVISLVIDLMNDVGKLSAKDVDFVTNIAESLERRRGFTLSENQMSWLRDVVSRTYGG